MAWADANYNNTWSDAVNTLEQNLSHALNCNDEKIAEQATRKYLTDIKNMISRWNKSRGKTELEFMKEKIEFQKSIRETK